jgi:hypothetical protein
LGLDLKDGDIDDMLLYLIEMRVMLDLSTNNAVEVQFIQKSYGRMKSFIEELTSTEDLVNPAVQQYHSERIPNLER